MPPLSTLRNIILDLPWKIMISKRNPGRIRSKNRGLLWCDRGCCLTVVGHQSTCAIFKCRRENASGVACLFHKREVAVKHIDEVDMIGRQKSQNTEALILSNIHSISPIQFDYFSQIISAFFGPCLGFPLKQTPGFQPMGKQTERGPKPPKGAWTGLVWNGVCWSLSFEWNAMCSTSAMEFLSKPPDSYPRAWGVSGFVERKAELMNIVFVVLLSFCFWIWNPVTTNGWVDKCWHCIAYTSYCWWKKSG